MAIDARAPQQREDLWLRTHADRPQAARQEEDDRTTVSA